MFEITMGWRGKLKGFHINNLKMGVIVVRKYSMICIKNTP